MPPPVCLEQHDGAFPEVYGKHHVYKTIQRGRQAQASGGLTSKMKNSLSKQDMHNTYVKGSRSMSFIILLAEAKFLDT